MSKGWVLKRLMVPALGAVGLLSVIGPLPAAHASGGGPSPLGAANVISYEPAGGGDGAAGLSTDLWATYNSGQVASDLSLIQQAGAGAVRVFIGTGDTGPGYPTVSPAFSANLASFVGIAKRDNLKVVLSIFNMYPYVPAVSGGWIGDEPHAKAWMASVLAPYRNDAEIAYIEMRNEIPAPGYDSPNPLGSGLVAAQWLNDMVPVLRTDAGSDPVVLSQNHGMAGYQALDSAVSASAKPDAYSYHFYDYAGFLPGQLSTLESSLTRPVFVGETGFSTATGYTQGGAAGLAADTGVRNAYQSYYLGSIASVTTSMGMGMPGVWTLFDMAKASNASQADFGLFSMTDSGPAAKPVVSTLSAAYAAVRAGQAAPAPGINGTFVQTNAGYVPSPWEAHYDAATVNAGGALSGNSLCVNTAGTDAYYYAVLPVSSGSHSLIVWSRGGGYGTSVAIRWLSLAGTPIGPDARVGQSAPKVSWTQLKVNSAAPAGASGAEVILQSSQPDCFSNVTFA